MAIADWIGIIAVAAAAFWAGYETGRNRGLRDAESYIDRNQ